MSLLYDDLDLAEKEEINMEKIDYNIKDREQTKNKKRRNDDILDREALNNIPTKSFSVKNKINKNNSTINLKDANDISLEGVELPLLNSNINNGSLMLTELLDLDNNNNSDIKSKSSVNIIEEKGKEKEKEKEGVNNNNTNNANNTNNSLLKKQLDNIKIPTNLKKGINSGLEKTNMEVRNELKNNILNISKRSISVKDLLSLNKSHSKIFLTRVEKISKENIKRLKNLKLEEQYIKKNIAKLELNKQLIEEGIPLKNNIVDINIRKNKLKNITNIKEDLVSKLMKINQKIDILLNEEKLREKRRPKQFCDILEDEQEQYNLRLAKLKEEQTIQRHKFNEDLKLAHEKRQKNLDKKEKDLSDKRNQFLKGIKSKDREMYLKRKNEADKKLEQSNKYIKEKYSKKLKEYRFIQYKEKFENNEKKLVDKVNMMKKDRLITMKELKELSKKIKEQKKILLEDAGEKKKQLLKLWSYRSQTLPIYKHPLTIKLEDELNQKIEKEEEERKKKECNELEKRNYKPPKVFINQKLKYQREIRKDKVDKESVLRTELNNKKRLDRLQFSPINSPKNLKIIHELSQELNNNNYIDYNEVKTMIKQKKKKILKPIQILHPKPDKPIDYLTEMILEKKKYKNNEKEKDKDKEIMYDIFHKTKDKGGNILESIKMAKAQTEAIDNKVQQKKQILHLNGGYLNNPQLGDEVGDLLIESIQTKLGIMNKLNGE